MSAWFDIIIFAAIAVFLALRLRNVLGERHGDEKERPNPYALEKPSQSRDAAVDAIKDVIVADSPTPAKSRSSAAPDSLQGRLNLIAQNDPNFSEKNFLNGAKSAFGMIITAFANEDTPTLRPLLSDDVYDSFASAIRARQAAKEKLETKILRIKDAEIIDASLVINTARVTVRLVSEQTQCTRDVSGNVVEGDASQTREVRDVWTFTRNMRALDPNWHLSETRSEA